MRSAAPATASGRRSESTSATATASGRGNARRHDRARDPEAATGQLLARLALAAAPARGAGVRVGDRGRLPGRRLDAAGGEARAAARRGTDVEEPSLAPGQVPGRDRRGLP